MVPARMTARLGTGRAHDWQRPAPEFPLHVLSEYALLADGERGVMVGPRGDFVWMCAPRWHSDAVFSTLIGGAGVYAGRSRRSAGSSATGPRAALPACSPRNTTSCPHPQQSGGLE